MSVNPLKKAERGSAANRIFHALAIIAPVRPTRHDLLQSEELQIQHRDEGDTNSLTDKEKLAASKAMGRLIKQGHLKEVIVPNPDKEAINLPETGLVAVSFSLIALNDYANENKPDIPTQAYLAMLIRENTNDWITKNFVKKDVPLFVKDIWIVHGSSSFDMMVMVLYNETSIFLEYIRRVIQQIPAVVSTHTMQITNSLSEGEKERHQPFLTD